ncbi:hypothetical protein CBS101457_000273 [Exobasidium rhododendri]|nr:hypothetical protein CBS101457_000273 [Exobasidium rhododendri]
MNKRPIPDSKYSHEAHAEGQRPQAARSLQDQAHGRNTHSRIPHDLVHPGTPSGSRMYNDYPTYSYGHEGGLQSNMMPSVVFDAQAGPSSSAHVPSDHAPYFYEFLQHGAHSTSDEAMYHRDVAGHVGTCSTPSKALQLLPGLFPTVRKPKGTNTSEYWKSLGKSPLKAEVLQALEMTTPSYHKDVIKKHTAEYITPLIASQILGGKEEELHAAKKALKLVGHFSPWMEHYDRHQKKEILSRLHTVLDINKKYIRQVLARESATREQIDAMMAADDQQMKRLAYEYFGMGGNSKHNRGGVDLSLNLGRRSS